MNALEFYELAIENAKQNDIEVTVGYLDMYAENACNLYVSNTFLFSIVAIHKAYILADINESHVYYEMVVKHLEHIEL